jgi:hypothetical protein
VSRRPCRRLRRRDQADGERSACRTYCLAGEKSPPSCERCIIASKGCRPIDMDPSLPFGAAGAASRCWYLAARALVPGRRSIVTGSGCCRPST